VQLRARILITVLCAGFALTRAAAQTPPSSSSDSKPHEVKPPRQAEDQHLKLALALGVTVLPYIDYTYQTSVTTAGGRAPLAYSGAGAAPGLTAFAGPELTLPGPLRRITLGTNFFAGGLYTLGDAVIPSGTLTPFSTQALQQTIKLQHSFGEGWHAYLTPYIEHDIVTIRDNKLRLGYQYSTQSGSYSGLFPPNGIGIATADYAVRMKYEANLIRFSWSNFLYGDDYGRGGSPNEHRTGLLRQMGISAGTHKTVEIFFAIGPVWDL
jgi:hypothetical protein